MTRSFGILIRAFFPLAMLQAAFVLPIMAQVAAIDAGGQENAEDISVEDGWIIDRSGPGRQVHTRELTLHPQPEPRPALKHRLLIDDYDLVDGNAAVYYLKALGFIEQNAAREQVDEFQQQAYERSRREGLDYGDVPPEVWRSTDPHDLPLPEVKEYLRLTSFQPPLLREATGRAQFDLDRKLREIDNPIGYLLPEIQAMRAIARTQVLRCRVAIAEGRMQDAIEILGQQYALARHLGQDEFLVSNLVGFAIAGIAWNDALYFIQEPDAPNLYWAFTALPQPLVDIRHAMAIERHFLDNQLKVLQEVDTEPRSVGYWQAFIDRLIPQLGDLRSEIGLSRDGEDPQWTRAAIVAYIAAAYPGAKEYLIRECRLAREQVEAYPTAQVVFLAVVRFYDQWRDEYFKWSHLPLWQTRTKVAHGQVDGAMRAASERYGFCALPANILLPALQAVRTAQARSQQLIALMQTVEAIRMYGAAHDSQLPESLDELPVPPPLEPFTGEPIEYHAHGNYAEILGHEMPGLQYRLVVRFANTPN